MKVSMIEYTREKTISDSASVCYASDTDNDKTYSLVHKHKHLAVLRFAFAVVKVSDISIACQNQIVRSKHLDFMVESKRYVSSKKGSFKFIEPSNLTDKQKSIMDKCWYDSKNAYETLITLGVKKEDARAILPMNTSTNMYIAGNLQAWESFFRLRISNHAQEEVREVARAIRKELKLVFPQVFIDEEFKISKG